MSRAAESLLLLVVCPLFAITSWAQGPHFSTGSFNCNTTDQCLQVQQNGTGNGTVSNTVASVPQPSLTNLPPAGVVGNATSTSGSSAGVLGTSSSSFGFGLLGVVSGTPGPNDNPAAIEAFALSTTGKTKGVDANIFSPDGVAVHAQSTGGKLFVGSSGPSGSATDKFTVDTDGNIVSFGSLTLMGSPAPGDITAGNGQFQGVVSSSSGVSTFTGIAVNGGSIGVSGGDISAPGGTVTAQTLNANTASFAGNLTVGGTANVSLVQAGGGNFSSGVSTGPLTVNGTLVVTGTKSSVAPVKGGHQVALYAVESPENWFEDFGSARLQNGMAKVKLESVFAETVNPDLSYHVFLTPSGDCRGLYVAEKSATGFVVRELGGGESTVAFDYRVVVRRKGYERVRLEEVPITKSGPEQPPAAKPTF